jgi:hypothetical protein
MRRLLTPRWLDLLLVLALVSLGLYIQYYSRLDPISPLANLLPNVTSDLFFVWLAARAIDAVIGRRQRREAVVRGIRGNINYMGKIASDLLPEVYAWRLKDLQDEYRWFGLTLERQARYLRADEKARAATVSGQLPGMIADAQQIRSVRREAQRLWEELETSWPEKATPKSVRDIPAVNKVNREYRQYFEDAEADPGRLTITVKEARRRLGELGLDEQLAAPLNAYLTAVETAVEHRQSLQSATASYVESMRDTEILLLGRVQD